MSLAIFVIEPSGVVIVFKLSRGLYNVSNRYNSGSYCVNEGSSLGRGLAFAGYREVNDFFLAVGSIFLYNVILIFFFEFNLLTGSKASIIALTAVAVIGTIIVEAAIITAAIIIVAAVTIITTAIKRACVIAVAATTAIAIIVTFTAIRPAVLVARVIAFRLFISAVIKGIVIAASEVTTRALAS